MPTYSYQCVKCGHIHDVFHAMSATLRVKCEKCKGPCDRLIGAGAGIIFKGSGFYETDYKKKSGSPSGSVSSEKKTESKAAEKPAAKTDSKPAKKSAD